MRPEHVPRLLVEGGASTNTAGLKAVTSQRSGWEMFPHLAHG